MRFLHCERHPTGPTGFAIASSRVVQASHCRVAVEGALADPCVELYFNFGPTGREVFTGGSRTPSSRTAWVLGPRTTTLLVSKELRDCDILAVRVHAGVAKALLGVPATELRGQLIDLEDLWGTTVAQQVREQAASVADPSDRLRLVERFVHARIRSSSAYGAAQRALSLCRELASGERTSVRRVAEWTGMSHRALIRTFDEHVGLKPKAFHRAARLRRVIETLGSSNPNRQSAEGWAAIAAAFGFSDQAHLIDEFRALTTVSPSDYVRQRVNVGHGFIAHRRAD
jgi:AraC-like DNA-binding protein